jgi:hypothetical protein
MHLQYNSDDNDSDLLQNIEDSPIQQTPDSKGSRFHVLESADKLEIAMCIYPNHRLDDNRIGYCAGIQDDLNEHIGDPNSKLASPTRLLKIPAFG